MILFLFFLVVALICLIAGYVFAKIELLITQVRQDIDHIPTGTSPTTQWEQHITNGSPSPQGEAYIIERPSAKQLSEWDENEQTKLSKEGMREALDKNPILRQAKEAAEAFMKGATQ